MKASGFKYSVLTGTLTLVTLILVLLPFHAFLTVWISTWVGNYTWLRLWKEFLTLIAAAGVLYLVLFDKKVRFHTMRRKLTWLILAYLGVQAVWVFFALQTDGVSGKAAAYGMLVNCRFLLFFLLAWALAIRTPRLERRWPKVLLWPAVIVVMFGLLQVFALPPDVMKHFGYGPDTITAVSTINSDADYQRYSSTLRGPNPLGAYLLLPISALIVLLVRFPRSWNWTKGLLLVGALAMLVFSFSRSAWLGALLSIMTIAVIAVGRRSWWRLRYVVAGALTLLIALVAVAGFALRDSDDFQNFVFHTEEGSSITVSSNDAHLTAIEEGVTDIVAHPIGHGPGTAGPASIYNTEQSGRISDNYYLQIGQETGIIGMVLFACILGAIAYLLYVRRQTPLALTLLAALVGISFINLLSHAWSDDTLAYIWWGLAGLAIGTPVQQAVGSQVASDEKATN